MPFQHSVFLSHLMCFWHQPKQRMASKTISLLITLTFVFPYLTWAFEGKSYPLGEPAVLYNHQIVKIPEAYAKVLDAYQGKEQLVIHVQDLHCNYEVQQNIANLLGHLAKEYGLKLVTIEGASLPVNVMHLATCPRPQVKAAVGNYFMQQGKLSGAEYYTATGKYPMELCGIEQGELYQASRKVVSEFLNDENQGYVYDLRELLNAVKPGSVQRGAAGTGQSEAGEPCR